MLICRRFRCSCCSGAIPTGPLIRRRWWPQDKPQGLVLWVNESARRQGVLPGLRYAAAFSLASTLRAGEVSPAENEKAVADLTERLMRFTPEVEPAAQEPGVFWFNGAGLQASLCFARSNGPSAIHQDLCRSGI